MPDQILLTKLTLPPVRARLVHRPQLLGRMNSCLNCKLMLVSAPAGFGKTTLVSEWVLESGRQSAWVSLDEADNDPVRFLMYLVAALRKIAPEFGEDILENLESLPSLSMEAHYIPLINEISEALPINSSPNRSPAVLLTITRTISPFIEALEGSKICNGTVGLI